MEYILPMLLIVFGILAISVGVQKAAQITMGLMLISLPFLLFGWLIINFFWVFVVIWFVRKLTMPKQKQARRNTYYRTYTGKEAEEFFKQFYRQNTYQDARSQNYGNYQQNGYRGQEDFNSWIFNKDKYYKELDVDKNCTKEELRKAYLKKVKEHHPDRFTNSTEQEKKYHEEKLKKINEAYDNLIKDFS